MNYLKLAAEAFLLVPLIAIVLNNVLPKQFMEKNFHLLSGLVCIIQLVTSAFALFYMAVNRMSHYDFSIIWGAHTPGSDFFSIHPISLVFLFFIGMVSIISVLVGSRTIEEKKSAYVNLLMTLMIGMNGMVLVNDLFSLYVFLDVVGLSSFVLIAMFRSTEGLEGSIKYLVMSELASVLILTGIAFIFMETGSLTYSVIESTFSQPGAWTAMTYVSLVLMLAGFAIKAGAAPFHSWLPDAHQSANTAISILLSGIVIKIAGVYGLLMLSRIFTGVKAIQVSLATIGMITIVVGALLALSQNHFKRIAAYSSVSQIGYILLGLSTGSMLGLIGAVAHVFSHAVFKSTLFANAAALHEQTGTLEIDKMGGLQSRMPVTAVSSLISFLSTAGIPPFAGFWSKLLIIIALWLSGNRVLAGFALGASILSAAYLLRLQQKVFFGKTPEHLAEVQEISGSIKFVEILLTAITSVVGVLFPLILICLQNCGLI